VKSLIRRGAVNVNLSPVEALNFRVSVNDFITLNRFDPSNLWRLLEKFMLTFYNHHILIGFGTGAI